MTTLTNTNNKSIKGGNAMSTSNALFDVMLNKLEAQLAEAEAINDFEQVAVIRNNIADLKGEPRPYGQEWFDDL